MSILLGYAPYGKRSTSCLGLDPLGTLIHMGSYLDKTAGLLRNSQLHTSKELGMHVKYLKLDPEKTSSSNTLTADILSQGYCPATPVEALFHGVHNHQYPALNKPILVLIPDWGDCHDRYCGLLIERFSVIKGSRTEGRRVLPLKEEDLCSIPGLQCAVTTRFPVSP